VDAGEVVFDIEAATEGVFDEGDEAGEGDFRGGVEA
jgi:hypothetical protein